MPFHTFHNQVRSLNETVWSFFVEGENDYLAAPLDGQKSAEKKRRDAEKRDHEAIEDDQEVREKQQKKWDELNKASFPASDPMAKY